MVDIEKLKNEEFENIMQAEVDDELYTLEQLILEGENAKIPVVFNYPKKNGEIVEVTAKLKPLTDVEAQNARRVAMKVKDTTINLELLKRGLYTKNDVLFPSNLIMKMHVGVVNELVEKLGEISGIKIDEEKSSELVDKLMGF